MTPEQERAIIEATERGFTDVLLQRFEEVRQRIVAGEAPRLVVEQALQSFTGEYAQLLSTAFTGILARSVGTNEVLELKIGGLTLSQKLYLQGVSVSENVQGVVERHFRGFTDGRNLAFQLFEGYGFRDQEPLVFNPRNPKLPRYLREALLPDPDTREGIAQAFARLQVSGLTTGPLRAAYNGVIDALQRVQDGAGAAYLGRKIEVAFYERMRYFANRIATTELHRAYMKERGKEIERDSAQYVLFRLSGAHPLTDICDLFANIDAYGKGAGIYPKDLVPVPPIHPWCLCTITPRPSITGDYKFDENADQRFLRSFDDKTARRIAGSSAKLDSVLSGDRMLDVHNAGIDPLYRVRTLGDVNANP